MRRVGSFSRKEILGIIAARHGQPEGTGDDGMFEMHFRITPELLEAIMGAEIVNKDGSRAILEGFTLDEDGYVEPWLKRVEAVLPS